MQCVIKTWEANERNKKKLWLGKGWQWWTSVFKLIVVWFSFTKSILISVRTGSNDNPNLWKHKYRCSSLHWSDMENRVDWEDDVLHDGKRKQSYQKGLFTNVLSFLGKWKYFLRSWTCKALENKASRYLTPVSCSGFPGSSDGRESAGDPGSILGSGRAPGAGKGNPLQCSCLENSMDRGVWWATVHRVTEPDTAARLSLLLPHVRICPRKWGKGWKEGGEFLKDLTQMLICLFQIFRGDALKSTVLLWGLEFDLWPIWTLILIWFSSTDKLFNS